MVDSAVKSRSRKRVVIYVSAYPGGNRSVYSISEQAEKCQLKCKIHDFEVVAVIPDSCTDGTLITPYEIQEMIEDFDADGVVVCSIDLLSDEQSPLSLLNQAISEAWHVVSATEEWNTATPSGRLLIQILTAFRTYAAELTSERTAEVVKFLREQGLAYTSKVFVYDKKNVDGKSVLVENPTEMQCIKRMEELRRLGTPYERIAKVLTQEGYKTAMKGGHWEGTTVRRILDRRERERNEGTQGYTAQAGHSMPSKLPFLTRHTQFLSGEEE